MDLPWREIVLGVWFIFVLIGVALTVPVSKSDRICKKCKSIKRFDFANEKITCDCKTKEGKNEKQ